MKEDEFESRALFWLYAVLEFIIISSLPSTKQVLIRKKDVVYILKKLDRCVKYGLMRRWMMA